MNDRLAENINFYRRATKERNKYYGLSPKEYGMGIACKRKKKKTR